MRTDPRAWPCSPRSARRVHVDEWLNADDDDYQMVRPWRRWQAARREWCVEHGVDPRTLPGNCTIGVRVAPRQ